MNLEKIHAEPHDQEIRTVSEPGATIRVQTVKIPDEVQEAISQSIRAGRAEVEKRKAAK